jgi:hypothetical protein
MMIFITEIRKKRNLQKTIKSLERFWTHMNYLIFYCFQLEQLVDLDMAINPSIKFSSYFKNLNWRKIDFYFFDKA